MTKRIVSGVFLLVALGALGLILAGALTSGEQLIVRFLTAIIVAALGLYVISDLRLQADDSAVANAATGKVPVTASRMSNADTPPPNSTAAFMATVTGKKSTTASLDRTKRSGMDEAAPTGQVPVVSDDFQDERADLDTSSGDQDDNDAELDNEDDAVSVSASVGDADLQPLSVLEEDQSPYSQDDLEVGQWPLTPDGQILEQTESSDSDEEEIDGLVAVFTKQAQQELRKQEPAMAMNGQLQPALVGGEVDHTSSFKLGDVFKSFDQPSAIDSPDNPAGSGDNGAASTNGHHSAPEAANGNGNGNGATNGNGAGNGSASNGSTPGNGNGNGSNNGNATVDGYGFTNGNAEAVSANGIKPTHDSDSADEAAEEASGAETAPVPAPVDQPAEVEAEVEAETATPAQAPDDHAASSLPRPEAELEAASYAQARIIDLRLSREATDEIEAAIRSGEIDVISSLMNDGVLSGEGPISDRDVRTMVYVAFTSNELRKILLAGGSVDANPEDMDLGPVEVFNESAPSPNPELAANRVALSAPEGTVTLAAATGEDAAAGEVSTADVTTDQVTPEDDELTSESASI